VAEGFELSDEASGEAVGVLAGEVVVAGVVVELSGLEHVPDRGEDGVPDRGDGTMLSPAAAQTLILGGEVGVFGPAGSQRGFGQSRSEPLVALPGLPGPAFTTRSRRCRLARRVDRSGSTPRLLADCHRYRDHAGRDEEKSPFEFHTLRFSRVQLIS
jgi:hypothetical protein